SCFRLKSTGGNPKLTTSYVYEPCEFSLSEGTFGAHIDSTAAQWGNRTGWVFMNESLEVTFAEYKKDVDQVCRGLLSAGFEKGDSVAIWSPNTYNWVVFYGAMAKAGIVSACVHPAYTAAEFERCLVKVGCKGIYIPESFKTLKYYQTLCNLIPELKDSKPGQINSNKYPYLKCVIVDSDKALPGCVTSKEIFQGGNSNLGEAEKKVGIDDPLTIVFTSGTTGHPKAAMLSHHGFVNNTMVYHYRNPLDTVVTLCNPLPFFHVYGMTLALGQPVVRGQKVVIPNPGYDTHDVLKAIHTYRCTEVAGAPTMITDMISHPERSKYDLSCLTKVVMGGNIVTTEVRKLAEKEFPHAKVWTGYGATETTTATTLVSELDPDSKRFNTVGRPLAFVELKIADPNTGVETPVNEPGEIWVRGHNIFLGYYGDEEKTREAITPARWYKTGDLGTLDEDGYLSIIGRLKDMVIRGGENIYPIEIEAVLNTHPAIEECLVIGLPDERMGEELCAWVVLKPDAKATDAELQEFCKGKLSHFKVPRYFVYEADYPKTAIGKAQKNLMRDAARKKFNL
ncbi:unnamed protein product, partial [Ixodes pacificus]